MANLAQEILQGFGDIISAPINNPSVLWIVLPLISIWFILIIYFRKHQQDKLGWNSAMANGITIFWVSTGLLKYLFTNRPDLFQIKFGISLFLLIYGVIVAYMAFKQELPSNFMFIIASPSGLYYPVIIESLLVYGVLSLTKG